MSEAFLDALHANPWASAVLDFPELNQSASSLVEERVAAIRELARDDTQHLRSESLVLLGPPGTGKTHLFSRVRGRLGPRAIFVHMRPLLHAGLSPSYVLNEAVNQLAQPSYGRSESQAHMLVGSLIGHFENGNADFPAAHLSEFVELPKNGRAARLEHIADQLLQLFPDLDDVFVDRLLSIPFEPPRNQRALLAWLAGQDCDPSQLARIGAAASMDRNNTVRALRTLASISALGSPLVLVFDQLENLIQRTNSEERITQYGNLIAELVDSTRGLLIVQMAIDSEWNQAIQPQFNASQQSRVVMKRAALALPTPKQSRALLELWYGKLEDPEKPFPWPFSSEQVDKICGLPGVTPRMLLSALREACTGVAPSLLQPLVEAADLDNAANDDGVSLFAVIEQEWAAQLTVAHQRLDEADAKRAGLDDGRLRDGILLATELASQGLLRAATDAYVQLEPVKAGGYFVCLLHQAHFRSITAALERVLSRPQAARGVVVREQWRPLSPTWKTAMERQVQVLARAGLVWHDLSREEAACLLALEMLLQLARSKDICDPRGFPVDEAQVHDYLRNEVHLERWALIATLIHGTNTGSAQQAHAPEPIEKAVGGSTTEGKSPKAPEAGDSASAAVQGTVKDVLTRLRVASIDRLIREVRRVHSTAGRTNVVDGLEAFGAQVQWFGRNVVAWATDDARVQNQTPATEASA